MKCGRWLACVFTLGFVLACSSARRYYSHAELQRQEDNSLLSVAPGPWPLVPAVIADTASIPDELVLPTLTALMDLPGASEACDPNTGRPRRDAAEYCVAVYRTPEDWRVSWPIRNVAGESDSCLPPYGGVEDADFGREVPVFGFAHNHPCAAEVSSKDLTVWPAAKEGEGAWVMVAYGATPGGRLARDSSGQPVPAWGWLATGPRDAPRFYKWNRAGEVFKWDGVNQNWRFTATCRPGLPSVFNPRGAPPDCSSTSSQ